MLWITISYYYVLKLQFWLFFDYHHLVFLLFGLSHCYCQVPNITAVGAFSLEKDFILVFFRGRIGIFLAPFPTRRCLTKFHHPVHTNCTVLHMHSIDPYALPCLFGVGYVVFLLLAPSKFRRIRQMLFLLSHQKLLFQRGVGRWVEPNCNASR